MAESMNPAITAVRELRKMSRAELGRRIGLSRSRIGQLENKGGNMRLKPYLEFLDLFGSDLTELGFTPLDVLRGRRDAA